MPVLASSFRPPAILRNGHVQTILAALWPQWPRLAFFDEKLELPDGDFLQLHWVRGGSTRLAIITHGLEGSAEGGCVRGLAAALRAAGWDVLAWDFRGCGVEPNRLLRFYHSGETGDLRQVIAHAAPHYAELALIGFSLGGNVTLKYLGESVPPLAIKSAVAISTPIDLGASARALDQRWSNRLYRRRFLKTLTAKIKAKARRFPGVLDLRGLGQIRTFQEFDDRFTAPLHGFRDAADYWKKSSARQVLEHIRIPALLINARNDPFLPAACFPFAEAKASAHLFLEAPASGGHVGFLDFMPGRARWLERRVVDFLALKGRRA